MAGIILAFSDSQVLGCHPPPPAGQGADVGGRIRAGQSKRDVRSGAGPWVNP